jgi:hypothetical protein
MLAYLLPPLLDVHTALNLHVYAVLSSLTIDSIVRVIQTFEAVLLIFIKRVVLFTMYLMSICRIACSTK